MTVFAKTLLRLSAIIFCLCAAFFITALVLLNFHYYDAAAQSLQDTAQTLYAVLRDSERSTDAPLSHPSSLPAIPYRVTLINTDGEVIWDSRTDKQLVNHLDREEVRSALEGREKSAARTSLSMGARYLYAAVPVTDAAGNPAGVFRLSLEVPGFWQRTGFAARLLAFTALFALCAAAAAWIFSAGIAGQLRRISRLVGEYGEIAENAERKPGHDEFAALEDSLRVLLGALSSRLGRAEAQSGRLEAVLDCMAEAVLAVDSELNVTLANSSARRLFNLPLSQSEGQNAVSLLEAARSIELEQAAVTARNSGKPLQLEAALRNTARRDSDEPRFLVFAAPLASAVREGGQDSIRGSAVPANQGAALVLQDISRMYKLEQVRKDFVANVSHELRTPIQLIKGFSETLLDLPADSGDQARRFIEIIRKNAQTMENLVSDLLTLASLENPGAQRALPALEEKESAALIDEAVFSTQNQARKKGARIIVDCPRDLTVKLRGDLIIQALINLLDNAIKYSPPDSRVWISGFREGGALVLRVRDEGIGIPPAHIERVFERFYRVDKARIRDADGTGLGLSIVRHIALIHGGTAEVESRAGEGSVFTLRIPLLNTRRV
ncbi:MAG: phosphate regulon sensor histidine kinase PhoR [Treponemataceae bacterium]|nr:MAG: phosphate regulon sensor histidine kinase PhoR [Treponemataceae bacterium]